MLAERLVNGDKSLQSKMDDYVSSQATLQQVSNPSGKPGSGGLGEPKFNVNMTEFTGPWGRPQRDGPPLRATALTVYANWLINKGQAKKARDTVWPVIATDLAYTTRFWNQTGYDLWEEVNGSSFFTLSASHRALVEGAALAKTLGKTCEGCAENAPQVLCFMQSFWVENSYIDSNINTNDGRTGKDANSLLSSIHTFDPKSKCTDATFQPCSSRALSNHKSVVDSFRTEYTINAEVPQGRAAAVGRYSEDVYFNGNPWYLATTAAAEQLYAAIYQWDRIGSITVDTVSLPFFKDLIPSIKTGTYKKRDKTYKSIVKAVHAYADDFIAVVKKYTPADGSLAEQYDRNTGAPLSAVHLTWSYAAFLTAVERREGIVSPSWGESKANAVPAVCKATPRCDAKVTFNVKVNSAEGENVFLVGSLTEIGNWSPDAGIALKSSDAGVWSAAVDVPSERSFEYKFIIKTASGEVKWEADPNRRLTAPEGCGSTGKTDDTFVPQ